MSKENGSQGQEEYVVLQQSDVVGFWDGEGTLHVKPSGFRSFPSKKFRGRTTTMIIGTLLSNASGTDKDGEELALEAGETVGIWYSPGMRPILTLKNQRVKLTRDESFDKDTGKGNPMKGYRIETLKNVQRVNLDNLSFDNGPDISAKAEKKTSEEDMDNVPF
jgi:hypothetical protein